MTDILWMTDPHLNFLPPGMAFELGGAIAPRADMLVVTGDIAEAHNLRSLLCEFVDGYGKMCYVTLGNHDYYQGSIADVTKTMENLHQNHPLIHWLDRSDPVLVDDTLALVGHQGWYDGRLGDPIKSKVLMSDFLYIQEFKKRYGGHKAWAHYPGAREPLLDYLREISQQAAEEARVSLRAALTLRDQVLFATHYPPFAGACWHEGNISDPHWMPWFTSACMGEMLAEEAEAHPDKEIIALCGHTHSSGYYEHLPNLKVLTGQAEYRYPEPVMTFKTPIQLSIG